MNIPQLALEHGFLSEEEVRAVESGVEPGETLDQALVRLGFLSEKQLAQVRREARLSGETTEYEPEGSSASKEVLAEVYQQALLAESKRYGISISGYVESNEFWLRGRYLIERTLGESKRPGRPGRRRPAHRCPDAAGW